MWKVVKLISLLLILTALGTVGIYFIESEYTVLDALYMAVITLSGVGFREVHPLSDPGKIFIIVYLVLGLGLVSLGRGPRMELYRSLMNPLDHHETEWYQTYFNT